MDYEKHRKKPFPYPIEKKQIIRARVKLVMGPILLPLLDELVYIMDKKINKKPFYMKQTGLIISLPVLKRRFMIIRKK